MQLTALPVAAIGLFLAACSGGAEGQQAQGLSGPGGTTSGGGSPTMSPPVTAGSGGSSAAQVGAGGATLPGAGGQQSIPMTASGGGTSVQPAGSGGMNPGTSAGGMSGAAGAQSDGTGFAPGSNDGPGIQIASIQTAVIPLPPGAEEYKCQNFKNPFGGKDVAVVESDSEMKFSHHMLVFHDPAFNADSGGAADCSGIEIHDLFHMAQTPSQNLVYPPDVGRKLPGTEGIRVAIHLLNTSSQAEMSQVKMSFHYGEVTAVKYIAVSLFLNNALLLVPPGMSTQSRTTGPLPATTNLLGAVSHMHKHSVSFTATSSDGVMIYHGTDWNEPVPTYFRPPYPKLKQGSTITWSCTFNNSTGSALTFGESAATNEMCILAGVVYPDQPGLDLGTQYEWVI